jgi:hypothetical protein
MLAVGELDVGSLTCLPHGRNGLRLARIAPVLDVLFCPYVCCRSLATESRPSAVHFRLRNQTRAQQIRNARIGQTITMPPHAVFQPPSFESPLVAKSAVVVSAMSRAAVPRLRCAESNSDQAKRYG